MFIRSTTEDHRCYAALKSYIWKSYLQCNFKHNKTDTFLFLATTKLYRRTTFDSNFCESNDFFKLTYCQLGISACKTIHETVYNTNYIKNVLIKNLKSIKHQLIFRNV